MKNNNAFPPPEYRMISLCLEKAGMSLVDFIEVCTNARHRHPGEENPLKTHFQKKYGGGWYMEIFRYAEPEIRYIVISESDDSALAGLFDSHRLGSKRIRELAEEYCDRVAYLFGLPVPLAPQPC